MGTSRASWGVGTVVVVLGFLMWAGSRASHENSLTVERPDAGAALPPGDRGVAEGGALHPDRVPKSDHVATSREPDHGLPLLAPGVISYPDLVVRVHDKLLNQTASCRSVQEDLLRLLATLPESDQSWTWAMSRAERCLRAPTRDRLGRDFLEALADLKPEHPTVRRQLGLSAYEAGDVREAIHQLQPAAEALGGFETWETLADARLLLARELQRGGDSDSALKQGRMAAQAAQMALEQASPAQLPFALHTMARAEMDLGNTVTALQWADRAIQSTGGVPQASQQASMIPDLHLFVGQIYYRAGQREAGLAYMNQGIAMSQSARQSGNLERIRDQFLRDFS